MNVAEIAGKTGRIVLILSPKYRLTPNPTNNGNITIHTTLNSIGQNGTGSTDFARIYVNPGVTIGESSVDTVVSDTEYATSARAM